jgi:cell division protein FtsB
MKQIKKINIILVVVLLFGLNSAYAQTVPKQPKVDVEKLRQQREKARQEREKILAKATEQKSQLKALQTGQATTAAEQNTIPVQTVVLPADNQPAVRPKQD